MLEYIIIKFNDHVTSGGRGGRGMRGRGRGGRSRGGFRGTTNNYLHTLIIPYSGGSRGFRGGR